MESLNPGIVKTVFSAATLSVSNTDSYSLLGLSSQLTYQYWFSSNPSAVSIVVQESLDNVHWSTIATSTTTTGASGTVCTSAPYIRAGVASVTGGSAITLQLVAKEGSGSGATITNSGGGDATAANQVLQITQETNINSVLGTTSGVAVITDANGTIQQYLRGIIKLAITAASFIVAAVGNVAAGIADTGNPVKIGGKGLTLGTNPTSEDADDRVNALFSRIGQLYVLAGHPNIVTLRYTTTGAGTDVAIIGSISAGTRVVVMQCAVITSGATTVQPSAIIGFGATNTPTTTGVVVSHPGIVAGGGISMPGMAIGGDGEELRITNSAPTTGSLEVITRYFTVTN